PVLVRERVVQRGYFHEVRPGGRDQVDLPHVCQRSHPVGVPAEAGYPVNAELSGALRLPFAPRIPEKIMTVITRFAPSPTGLLHIGGVRTALFSWLYARRMAGKFILRIEHTVSDSPTPEAVRVILEGRKWLGLDHDLGPYYQTQRFDRYKEVIAEMLKAGTAYHCYCSKADLDAMRADQQARKEKPRYDGRCRHGKGPGPGSGNAPVVRF